MNSVFIPGNVPNSKSHQGSLSVSKPCEVCGHAPKRHGGAFHSKAVTGYLQSIGVKSFSSRRRIVEDYVRRSNLFRIACGDYFQGVQYPFILGMHFVRDSRRKFDFNNASQIIQDLLVAHGMIEDDNMSCMVPVPYQINGHWYTVDKTCPGVFLRVFKDIQMAA